MLNDLLKWEKMNFIYQSALKSVGENPNEATQAAIDEIAETKEKVELELQKSQMLILQRTPWVACFPFLWYNKEKGADTMMNPAMFDPIALDAWYSDENNDSLLQTELEHYLQNYFSCFSQQPQRRLFQTFIQGLLSPLERKSICLLYTSRCV